MKQTSVKVRRKSDETFKREAVQNWLSSGTDTDVIFWARGGIPSALISLPNRYLHSPWNW